MDGLELKVEKKIDEKEVEALTANVNKVTNEKIEKPKVETPKDPVKQVVKVPNTGLDSLGFIDVIVLVFVVAGICYIVYVQRKKQ